MEESWAAQEMSGALIRDRRRIKSVIQIVENLADQPGVAFSTACGPAGRQAAHRLFEHQETTVDRLLAGHRAQTAERCWEYDLVLAIQDTTSFEYHGHQAKVGLGPTNDSPNGRGLFAHTVWAMSPEGLPLGTLHVQMWVRDAAEAGSRHQRRARTPDEKESHKWRGGLEGLEAALPPDQAVLLIQDREGDVFDFLAAPRRANTHLLIRANQPRAVTVTALDGSGALQRSTLFEAVEAAPVLGTLTVRIGRRPGQPEREATLTVRRREMAIQAPQRKGVARGEQQVWVVQAREEQPPEGVEAVEWVLISTLPALTSAQAYQIVRYYSRRWGIERFHYTLKSGCQVEKLQIDDVTSLEHALAVYYVVAWRLQHLTHLARLEPERPAQDVLAAEELAVLSQAERRPIVTIQEAVRAIAKLGGWTPSRQAPEPGVKVLWLGVRRLDPMVEGWRLARQAMVTSHSTYDTR
jgi:Transposase Tn5 dimerisation domain/Transposase DNA-binding